jgi:antitoxin component of RelBE/YafQ-DinJ toxin-antitoxin module
MANTPLRSFRISDDLYNSAKAQADSQGLSLTAVIVAMLESYAGGKNVNP